MRYTWTQTFSEVAVAISKRSECDKAQVGAVVVDSSNRILATGYNGKPERFRALPSTRRGCGGFCHRGADGPKESCIAIHAEANALLWGSRRDREGGTIYITRLPCLDCAKLIANSGLAVVLCKVPEEDKPRLAGIRELLWASGVVLELLA